ncbi:MAG: hypothetical protein WBG65_03890 [Sulfurimonadaceae bacterium]
METTTLTQLLYDKYGTLLLKTEDVAKELNRSVLSLIRDRQHGRGLKYVKHSKSTQGRVYYSVEEIANYIISDTSI